MGFLSYLASADGVYFVMRWLHYIFGIIWIGHLYYFNFTQAPFFAETDATTKSNAIQKLLPRALWWFRWGAMFTFLTGMVMLLIWGARVKDAALMTSFGLFISIGSILGTLMFLNVWLVIWPNQKVVIESATLVAQGKAALPNAAASGAKALLASRTNVMFSMPMLLFMGAASHLPLVSQDGLSNYTLPLIVSTVVIALLEANAIFGKLGPLASIKGVIHCGLGLAVALLALCAALV
jgi:uncharacterized membrane protein